MVSILSVLLESIDQISLAATQYYTTATVCIAKLKSNTHLCLLCDTHELLYVN